MNPKNLALVAVALCSLPFSAGADEAAASFSTSTSSATFGAASGEYLSMHDHDDGPNRFSSLRFEIHLDLGWYSAAGVGARVEFPVTPYGILEGVDDEIALSFGAEVYYFYTPNAVGLGVFPIAAVQWNFFVGRNVSLFPELGVAFLFGPTRDAYWATFVAPYLGFGLRLHFTDRNALLVRVSWPAGLQLGITF